MVLGLECYLTEYKCISAAGDYYGAGVGMSILQKTNIQL